MARSMPGLGLTAYFGRGASNWDTEMDANLRQLSALSQLVVASITAGLPASPADGVVTVNTTNGAVTVRDNGAWVAFPAKAGWRAFVTDVGRMASFKAGAWVLDNPVGAAVGLHAATMTMKVKTVDVTTATGKVVSLADAVPNGSLIVGLAARTMTTVTGTTSVYLDIAGAGTWGNGFTGTSGLATPAGSVRDFCAPYSPPYVQYGALALNVCVQDNAAHTFTGGKVRVSIYYFETVGPDASA